MFMFGLWIGAFGVSVAVYEFAIGNPFLGALNLMFGIVNLGMAMKNIK